jgi:PAS domain S-box-containing protein
MKLKSATSGNIIFRYAIALCLVGAITYLKFILFDLLGHETPFLLYFGAITLSILYLGKGPAIMVTLLSVTATIYFFMPPYDHFGVNSIQLTQVLTFVIEGSLIIFPTSALLRIRRTNQELLARWQSIIEKSSDGVVIVDQNGKRSYCSPSVENIIGYSADEYLHLSPWQLGHAEELSQIKEQYTRLTEMPGSSLTLIHRMKHKKGHWIWVESRVTNLLHEPNIRGLVANFNDVSARLELEQTRKDFIGIVSHELKIPLTSIKAYAQMIRQNLSAKAQDELSLYTSKILYQTDKLNNMLTDLADVATIRAGQMKLDIVSVDMTELILELIENFRTLRAGHTIKAELPPLPDIQADRERICQVLVNLISNAIKYSPDGCNILIGASQEKNDLIVFVQDQGIGIPLEDQNKVFDRLYRVNTAHKIKGLGLGLYICQRIIKQHHGEMGLNSIEGKGSTFWFKLPFQQPTSHDASVPGPRRSVGQQD